jgi:2-polyprenyl-3-methyl-5-hydroxy-6-metoxy-1,4-benzoquinol methylase
MGDHPLCDDLIKINSKKKNINYKIEIIFCKNCIIAYQKYQVKKKILFPKNYHYRSRLTEDVIKGMKNLVSKTKKICSTLKNKVVLDIGCNDGTLLDIFKSYQAITIGIEPTDAAKEAKAKGHNIYQSYIDKKISKKIRKKHTNIDIVVFTNVFAHIENLKNLIKNLRKIISKDTIIVIENHYLGSIIKKKQFDTFYHEHPRTYSLKSFVEISKLLKMNLFKYEFPDRYGGNIRVMMSKRFKNRLNFSKILQKEELFFLKLKSLNKSILTWKNKKRKLIKNLVKKYGPLPAKAFPGRAAILLKLLELNHNSISTIFEQNNSPKIGHYAPGTKIPILSDEKLKNINPNIPIVNFAWHIKNEIKKYLIKNNIRNKIVDILENKDFR